MSLILTQKRTFLVRFDSPNEQRDQTNEKLKIKKTTTIGRRVSFLSKRMRGLRELIEDKNIRHVLTTTQGAQIRTPL